jgi:tetratricopeptide (TPR) repeat protein
MSNGDRQESPGSGPPGDENVAGERGSSSSSRRARIRSGSMTALLEELAAIPQEESGSGWSLSLVPGAVIGRFELVREIGRGGFGVVWEARDRQLGRRVAFKAVRAGGKAPLREQRLLSEAEAAAKLSHANIVTLHDVGRTEQGPYLVLEYLEGKTLEARLGGGPIPVRETVHIAVEIAKGVAHAHAHGVVHRDLKPANVVLADDGRVKVLDFGMAYAFGRRREDGGTPAYMAPEQSSGAPEDERTDVFAMGAMLYQMLSGELPYPVGSGEANRSWRKPQVLDVPEQPALGELVERMLEKDPTRRPRDGAEVLEELSEIQRALEASTSSSTGRVRKRRRTSSRVALGVVAGALLGMAAAGFATWRTVGPPPDDNGRITVAVADFANETRDPDLDGLSGLLITSLEQSKKLRVLTRGRMIDLVKEVGGGEARRIDESVARAAGRKAGVRTLLLASIQKLGDTYAAELRAVDPQKDEYLFTLREQASAKNDLLPLIDRISDRTRLALRESEAEVKGSEVTVGEAVTGNLEAYRYYFRGKDLAARGLLGQAAAEFRKAIELEPRFALAQIEVAWIGYSSGASRTASRAIVQQAIQNAPRAPEKEAGLLRILAAYFDGRFAEGRKEIQSLVARYPDDRDVLAPAAQLLAWSGYYEDALPAFERALRLAPDWDLLRFDQAALLASLGRPEEALRLAEQTARARNTPAAKAAVGVARYLAGDAPGGIAAFRSSGMDDAFSTVFVAEGLAAQGKIDEALATAAHVQGGWADLSRAVILGYAGRLHEGLGILEAASRRGDVDRAHVRQTMARYLAAAGDPKRARELSDEGDFFTMVEGVMLSTAGNEGRFRELVGQLEQGSPFNARYLRALAAYRAGDRKRALAELRALDKGTVSFVMYFRGLAAAEEGLDQEAVDAFRRFERPVFFASDGFEGPWFLARARFLEARSLDRLGRGEEARKVLDLQLARWSRADPDLPLLREMKALREKLAVPPPIR